MPRPRAGRLVSTGLPRPSLEERPQHRHDPYQPAEKSTIAHPLAHSRSPWIVTYRSLLLALSMTSALMTSSATLLVVAEHSDSATNSQLCTAEVAGCAPDDGVPVAAPSHGVDTGTPPAPAPTLRATVRAHPGDLPRSTHADPAPAPGADPHRTRRPGLSADAGRPAGAGLHHLARSGRRWATRARTTPGATSRSTPRC